MIGNGMTKINKKLERKYGVINMAKGDMMLPIKTDKDIIRYLREKLRLEEFNLNNMVNKYCKLYKSYKSYRLKNRRNNVKCNS